MIVFQLMNIDGFIHDECKDMFPLEGDGHAEIESAGNIETNTEDADVDESDSFWK